MEDDTRPGRKSEFGDQEVARLNIQLPRTTLARLSSYLVLNDKQRNPTINEALLTFLEIIEKEGKKE